MWSRRAVVRSDAVRVVVTATTATLLGTLVLDRTAAAVAVPMDAAAGLGLALGVVLGPWVAVGTGLGYVLTDLVTGTFGVQSAVAYASAFVLVYVGVAFWNTLDRPERTDSAVRAVGRFAVVAVPATVGGAAVAAWGAELLASAPFAIVFTERLPGSIVGASTIGVVTVLILQTLDDREIIAVDGATDGILAFTSRRTAFAVAFVLLLWGTGGTLLSVAFQPFQLEYTQILANRFGWIITSFIEMVGPAGRNLQVIVGFVGLVCLVVGLSWTESNDP